MAKIAITDIVQLALKGYKPTDIKELLAMAEEFQTEQTAEEPTAGSAQSAPAGEPGEPQVTEKEQEPEKKTEPDYKALYETAAAELKQAQAANRRTPGPEPDPEADQKALQDVFRSYM